jgi:hypothetical protein
MSEKPRRRIEVKLTISADDWDALRGALDSIERQIAQNGGLPGTSISGGYDRGWILECSEKPEITHDSWYADLTAHLEGANTEPQG